MRLGLLAVAIVVALALSGTLGCGAGVTTFLNHDYNFEFVERVAIIPLDNLSDDRGAGARSTHVLMTEMLAAEAFDVVEPGEVSQVLSKYALVRTSELTTEQIIAIGKELKVQALFLGAVTESSGQRSGAALVTKVAMTMRLVETERGITVWSASATAGGRGFWASLFGTSGKSASEVTRDCVRKVLRSLLH